MDRKPVEEASPHADDPHATLEAKYMAEYLSRKGYSLAGLAALPEEAARQLRKEASLFASLRLAELETGAALVEKLHMDDVIPPAPSAKTMGSTQSPQEENVT